MIGSINFSLLTNEVLATFAQRSLSVYGDEAALDPAVAIFFTKAGACLKQYQKVFKRVDTKPYTEYKARIDSERDEAFIAFRNYVEACSHRDFDDWMRRAEVLLKVINRHGWSAWSEGYQKQSAIMTSLISELKGQHQETLERIEAVEWLDELVQKQEAFEQAEREGVSNVIASTTISETRPPLEEALRSLFSMTDLLCQATSSEDLAKIIAGLNNLISQTMATARATTTRQRNQEAKAARKN